MNFLGEKSLESKKCKKIHENAGQSRRFLEN